jgi:predicted transcriptional regulator
MNNRDVRCPKQPDGSSLEYPDLGSITNVTANKTTSSGFESKVLIDVMNEIEGKCVTILRQCKSQYPVVDKSNEKSWITSIDQDNKIVLAHTIEKSEFPILYNTPRMCDPGITESKNWSLQNYIETRLFLFKYKYNYGKDIVGRNTNTCSTQILFDFRPFIFSVSDPDAGGKKLYINQWIQPSDKKIGFVSYVLFSRKPIKQKATSLNIFKSMVKKIQERKLGNGGTQSFRNGGNALNIGTDDASINAFLKFIQDYDGVGFIENDNSQYLPPKNNKANLDIPLTNDILRMFYFDMIHDEVVKRSEVFRNFKTRFLNELRTFGDDEQAIQAGPTGKIIVGRSYSLYQSLLKYRMSPSGKTHYKTVNGSTPIRQIPAFFKTVGDLAQYMYAGKHNTFVASGDRMGIAVGLYVNARSGVPVKCMIEDSITGFVVYTNQENIRFRPRNTCATRVSGGNACVKDDSIKITSKQFEDDIKKSLNPGGLRVVEEIEAKKPRGSRELYKLARVSNLNDSAVKNLLTKMNANGKINTNNNMKRVLNNILTKYKNKPNSEISRKAVNLKSTLFPTNIRITRSGTQYNTRKQNLNSFLKSLGVTNQTKYLNQLNRPNSNLNTIKSQARKDAFKNALNKLTNLTNTEKRNITTRMNQPGSNLDSLYRSAQNVNTKRKGGTPKK